MRFNFVGTLDFNAQDARVPGFKDGVTKKGKDYATANPIVIAEKNNRGFCEFFGQKDDIIKTLDTDGNAIEISYDNAKDEDVIKSVAFFKRYSVTDGDDRKDFLSKYDYAKYLREHAEELKGKRVLVNGQTNKNEYKGRVSDRFEVQSIRIVADDDKDYKNGLQLTAEIFFTKDSLDFADFKTEKKVTLSGYTSEYAGKSEDGSSKYEYYPIDVVLDCSKVDFENEKHIKMMNFRLKQMGAIYEDGKITNKLKAKCVYSNMFVLNLINGNEEVEFDESQLTDVQKEAIELGFNTLDDFKPKGKIYGDNVRVFKIKSFTLEGDYSEGLKTTDETVAEFEEKIHVIVKEEVSVDEVMEEKKEDNGFVNMNEPIDDELEDELDDLF